MPGVCPRCLREVYFAEEKLALGKVWHNFCFSCRNCRKLLDSWTVATHSGELFCRNCYNRLFSITSVRTAFPAPRISHILPPVDNADPATLSPCDSLSDCCCCCCCNEDSLFIDPQNQDFEIRGSSVSIDEKQRLRGGRDEEPREADQILETGASKRCSESENSKLEARSSADIIDEPPSSSTAVAPWYNRQQSASQSVVSHPPSSIHQLLVRPSSTPVPAQAVSNVNANSCSAHRKPGNPCRANHGHNQYSKHCHRYHCYDSQNSDRARASQEHGKIIKLCQGRNFVQNYRNCLRSASPVGRSAGGGGCPPISNCQQQQDDMFTGGSCCSPKLPTGCECLGGGLDCQRCGRKVYQAEMQIASGVPYHNICFSCFCCRKPLETLTYHENCGEIYCKQCYVRNFGPQGYGYSGVLQTPM